MQHLAENPKMNIGWLVPYGQLKVLQTIEHRIFFFFFN